MSLLSRLFGGSTDEQSNDSCCNMQIEETEADDN